MASSTSCAYWIESLHGESNLGTWKVQISDILQDVGVWGHIVYSHGLSATDAGRVLAEHATWLGGSIPAQQAHARAVIRAAHPLAFATVPVPPGAPASTVVAPDPAAVTVFTSAIGASNTAFMAITTANGLPDLFIPTGLTDVAQYVTNDTTALVAIWLRVDAHVITHLRTCESARAVWDIILQLFEPQGTAGIVFACRTLNRTEMAEGANMEEHVRLMRSANYDLALLGFPMLDAEFTMTILTTLPGSWDPFVMTIDIATLRSEDLICCLLDEDRRRRSRTGTTDSVLFTRPG